MRADREPKFTPDQVRHKLCELVKEVTRPGYYGQFTATALVRDGQIVAFTKEVKETDGGR